MPHADRVPQNSASSSHQTFFSDLQAVYRKIIQTSGASFPLRSKDNRKSVHTASSISCNRQHLTTPDSLYNPRLSSGCDSVDEIVIKPLQFHDRELYSHRRLHSAAISTSSASTLSVDVKYGRRSAMGSVSSECSSRQNRLVKTRSRSSIAFPVEYSEQSIRYVAEQVSLEKARQLKIFSNIKQHRVDRKYFVCGSKLRINEQAFDESMNTEPQINAKDRYPSSQYARRRNHLAAPPSRKGLSVSGQHLNSKLLHVNTPVPTRQISDDVDETSTSAVAIPTAPMLSTEENKSIYSKDSFEDDKFSEFVTDSFSQPKS